MSIIIDRDKCKRCQLCLNVCPGNLIYSDKDNKAYIKYPEECWGCTACLKECVFGAIKYYIGADAGGLGGSAYVVKDNKKTIWHIETAEEKEFVISTSSTEGNKY